MGRRKSALTNLSIGETMSFKPQADEDIKHALARLRRLGGRYRGAGLAFKFRIEGEEVRAERVEPGTERKLGDWSAMAPNETRILKTEFSPAEFRQAERTAEYLRDRYREWFTVYPATDGKFDPHGKELTLKFLGDVPGRKKHEKIWRERREAMA